MKRVAVLLFVLVMVLSCTAIAAGEGYGYANEQGEVVIPLQWDYANSFSEGRALVFEGTLDSYGLPDVGKYGFIDTDGNAVTEMVWDDASSFSEGLAMVKRNGKCGFIDVNGELVVPLEYDFAANYSSGYVKVFNGTLTNYGYPDEGVFYLLDKEGNVVLQSDGTWEYFYYAGEGLVQYEKDDKCYFASIKTGETLEDAWDYIGFFNEGLCYVEKDGLNGFVDASGTLVIDCQYDYAYSFRNGKALVRKDGKYSLIDKTGATVVDYSYDYVNMSSYGYGYAFKGTVSKYNVPEEETGKFYMIDERGNALSESVNIENYSTMIEKGWKVKVDGKTGLIGLDGEWQIEPEYEGLFIGKGDVIAYAINGMCGLMNIDGTKITEPVWTDCAAPSEGLVVVQYKEPEPDFRQVRWGMSKSEVIELEGLHDYFGEVSGLDATYIGYDSTVMDMDCILAYYFCDDGLYGVRYIMMEEHSNENLYIDDYAALRSAFTKKYGTPLLDREIWDNSSHKSYYADKMGKALNYGYLTYRTEYTTERTYITMEMFADNYEISTIIDYDSRVISPGEADFSDEI